MSAASESLRMIRESAAGIAPRTGDFRRIRALRFTEPGFDKGVWRQMCEMGWPGLLVSEAHGGSGLGVQEFCALTEELGASLLPEPLIPAAFAAMLLPGDHLESVLSGERIVLPAWQEKPHSIDVTGSCVLSGGRLSGRKMFVSMGIGADAFLVTVPGGLALAERNAPGVHVVSTGAQDGGNFATVTFDNAPAEAVAGDAGEALEVAALATSAYLLGAMDRVFGITLEYLKTREQFGRKIGTFQALQHRSADLKIQLALTAATVNAAARTMDESKDARVRKAAVSRAKARASDAASIVTRGCIQLHGGIGYTDAADPGLFLRKMMVLAPMYGSAALHRARYQATAPDLDED
ncbi:MAG: acyl-CoA dehydrogenase [Acetobacteraceae bacterium]|nr:acyl-CoA dehydrogenase [Acetobacteraceae bacterium]